MPRVLFTAAARADLDDALSWYEAHAPEVVPRFREALRAAVERIAANPKQFLTSSHETRRALLRHFPYFVIFRETPRAAYVVAVFHTSRNPRIWQRRTL
ncbi:MAG: type II toxin-antitoxin system RelE/ParE family toxin [Hyphomicrobiales bacterium]|nr:type II toxin-antitoxin system RelE/ParE family toxin [Hyphomicrobiales bacterium]MBV9518103.1 type II toxin-antitoxin system RelE/ParE family toxin [Hyphomicrobiales bacterium]